MDKQRALDLLEQVVAEKGDGYIYDRGDGCMYAAYDEDGTPVAPACLVGHWAVKAGVNLMALQPHEGRGADSVLPLLDLGIPNGSDPVARALQQAQTAQDSGTTWGDALIAAKEVLCAPDTD